MKQFFSLLLLPVLVLATAFAQNNVGINTTPDNSAALHVQSTTQGMLVPRMTQSDRDLIPTPATGLLVYQTDNTPGFYFYNGTAWTSLSGGGGTTYTAGTGIGISGGVISNTGDNDNSTTNEIELPTQTGQSGKFLTTNGSSVSWATPSSGGGGGALKLYATKSGGSTFSVTAAAGSNAGQATSATFAIETEVNDPDNAYASNTYTVPTGGAGTYLVSYNMVGSANNSINAFVEVLVNGTMVASSGNSARAQNLPTNTDVRQNVTTVIKLSDGDTVAGRITNANSLGTITVQATSANSVYIVKLF